MTLDNPTTDARASAYDAPAETIAWPDLAMVSDLCSIGVPFDQGWEMPPVMARKLLAIRSAQSVAPDHRAGGQVMGTMAHLMSF